MLNFNSNLIGVILGGASGGGPASPISSESVVANGDGTVTLSYSYSGVEPNKPPRVENVVISTDGVSLTNIEEGDQLTATVTRTKRAPAQSWATSTIAWYTASDRYGTDKTQVGTGATYTIANGDLGQKYIYCIVTAELNPANAGNPTSDPFPSKMVGPTALDLPFGTVAPQTWIKFADWSLSTHTAPNLGDLGGNASVVATFSNPTSKNGDSLIIDCEGSNHLVQIPGENYNIDTGGTLTVFIKYTVTDSDNAGIISWGATDYFQQRAGDMQLRANSNANFGTSSSSQRVAKIQLKTGTDQSVVDFDSAIGTNTTRAAGNPSNGLYTNYILGATSSAGNNPAGTLEVEEVIVYTQGNYNDAWDNDAKTYFGV